MPQRDNGAAQMPNTRERVPVGQSKDSLSEKVSSGLGFAAQY